MHLYYVILISVFCLLVFNKSIAQDDVVISGVNNFQVVAIENSNLFQLSDGSNSIISLGRFGSFQLELSPVEIVAPNCTINGVSAHAALQGIETLAGYSLDGGEVRLTIADAFTYGFITNEGETYWIEPAWYYRENKTKTNQVVVYKQSDVVASDDHKCGVHETEHRIKSLHEAQESNRTQRIGQCYEVDLAIASDHSMYAKYNSSIADVIAHNVGVINNVNGNYTGSFEDNIEFVIATQYISTCSTCDPWTSSTNPGTLLNSFTDWGYNGGFGVVFDLGELWSNRNFDGQTVGLAWIDQLCGIYKYHILQDYSMNANELRVLTAHEIGHNFGALHDGNSSPHIMAPFVQITSTWSNTSKNVISATIDDLANNSTCLSACISGSPPVAAFNASSTTICAGNEIQFTDISSNSPTQWYWVFENGSPATSTDQHPVVSYFIKGDHKVSLTVENNFGNNTLIENNYIEVEKIPEAEFSFEVDNRMVAFQEQITPIVSLQWNFGDGSNSNLLNPVHTYAQNGTYEVELTSTTVCGSKLNTMLIKINPCINNISVSGNLQDASFVAGSEIICEGQILPNQEVHLHAPDGILIASGFDMPLGAVLNVTNNGCVN